VGTDWLVTPGRFRGGGDVDCGLAGTVMRFVPPVAALADGEVRFDGDPAARARPMAALLGALRALGVPIRDAGRGTLPFVVVGRGRVAGGAVTLDASASSQFLSGLLLAGCRYGSGLTVRHDGPPVPSLPHVEMTLAGLRERGVDARRVGTTTWRVEPGTPSGGTVTLEPDLSNAAPFLAAALVGGGTVRVPGWPRTTTQPGDQLRALLGRMGAQVTLDASGLSVRGTGRIHGVDADLGAAGELTPVVVALAALADSPSTLRGVGHLRGHETDRLAALATELGRLGGDVTETEDGLAVRPRPLRAASLATYGDHRMAQAAAVLGLAVPGILVADVATTAKTLPDFVRRWDAMLGRPAAA
jgi:3-phosphoshikimate 1-carboxyvinyltransferase